MKFIKLGRKPFNSNLAKFSFLLVALLLLTLVIVVVVKVSGQSGAPLLISEFRVRGIIGANDEFVEIYNNSDSAHVVASSDGSSGYSIAASEASHVA